MVRTMELILGLKPMSQFDAAAHAALRSFQAEQDLRPYDLAPANVNLDEKESVSTAWGAHLKNEFRQKGCADDYLLNGVVFTSVRGPNSPMPAPVHAAFVFGHKDDDD